MPNTWKQLLADKFGNNSLQVTDDILSIFVEAVSEEIPWFAEVVTWERRSWLKNELNLALKDIASRRR
jgi:hypothetical protein